jgi:small nuclear ribonucleoprotein (snRNP)-like protein
MVKKNKILLVIVGLILIGVSVFYLLNKNNNLISEKNNFDLNDYELNFREANGIDGELFLVNKKDNSEMVVIRDTKKLKVNMLKEGLFPSEYNQNILDCSTIKPLSFLKDEIYFMIAYERVGPIFAFNINSLNVKKIESFDYKEPFIFSLDKTKAVSLSQFPSKFLYLIDFINDSREVIVELEKEKTFEFKLREMDAYYDIKWLDENNLKVKVYRNEIEIAMEDKRYVSPFQSKKKTENILMETIFINLNNIENIIIEPSSEYVDLLNLHGQKL